MAYLDTCVLAAYYCSEQLSDAVNRVHYQHVSYVLLKNGRPYAKLIPESANSCSGKRLAAILSEHKLPLAAVKTWRRDLRAAHKVLKPQADKWR